MFVMKELGFVYWPTTLLFLNKIKTVLKNDLETFLYLKFRICFLFFDKLSLNSSFEHFCYCKKVCILKKSVNVVVNFVLEFIHKFLIYITLLKILLLTTMIFLMIFVNSLNHLFLLTFALIVVIL